MFDVESSSIPGILHVDIIEDKSLYTKKARCEWLLEKIRHMELTHSKLSSEAEDRVSRNSLSWSQMVFTDIFGPDINRLGEISVRLQRLEKNISSFKQEAEKLFVDIKKSE
jgi:hypothetical protein